METKNEVIPVSEEATVSAESTAANAKKKSGAKADSSVKEKKSAEKKPARKSAKKASADAPKKEKKDAEETSKVSAPESVNEPTPNAESTAPSVSDSPLADAPVKEAPEAEAPKKKPATRRKSTKTEAAKASAKETPAPSDEVKEEKAEEKASSKETKTALKPKSTEKKSSAKKPAAKKAAPKKKAEPAPEAAKPEEEPVVEQTAEAVVEQTAEPIPTPVEAIAEPAEAAAEQVEAPAEVVAEPVEVPVEAPAEEPAEEPVEEKQPEPQVDVSGTPAETFFFMSPGQISAMEEEKARLENEEKAKEEPEAPVIEVAAEAPVEEAPIEEPSVEEAPVMETPVAEAPAEAPVEETLAVESAKVEADSAQDNRRRNDPHQKDVMDKDRIRKALVAFLEETEEIDRRVLIESTMKLIPLTDEEREDNRPVSLSNRVRSVIGSVLSEMSAAGKIRAVSGGRKVTMCRPDASEPEKATLREEPKKEQEKPARAARPERAEKAEKTEKVEKVEKAEKPEKTEKVERAEKPEKIEKIEKPEKIEASIDGGAPAVIDLGFIAPPPAPVVVAPAPVAAEETKLRGPKEEEEEQISASAPIEAESADQEEAPVEIASPEHTAVHPTVRRVRASSRGERSPRPTVAPSSASAVLITEEEIERVIFNAIRRNSATKNDILAALKRTYVDPYGLRKEEENRLYTIATNLLQKLLARNAIQTVDGRYMNKPSHRVLNPGVAQSAYSTGNVEMRFINELNRQSGDFFEQFAAKLLEKYFEMSNVKVDASYVVGGSDDNGIDIMIETTDFLGYRERVLVQAKKRATQPVTLKEVREFYGALCAEEGTRGVFITTSSFCMEASKMIGKVRNLIAIDKRKLFALAEHCEVGLYRDEEGRLLLDENLFLEYDV